MLGWAPETFWKSSVIEFLAAIEGWSRLQRGKAGRPEPVSREEAEDMFAEAERVVAKIAAKKAATSPAQ